MATKNRPYFTPRPDEKGLLVRWARKREKKKICKANRYDCAECIYHEHIFDGAIFRGTKCRLED